MRLNISDDLQLPLEAVTSTFGVLAKRGAGKSFLAGVLAEEMLEAGQQVVILDPTGAHYGLKSSANGKTQGYAIVVFGGDHADLPLEEQSGEMIAEALRSHHFPAIIDLSLFRKGQMIRFVTTFLETLYRKNRQPLHLIVDEADTFAPQRLMGEEARMCGAMEDVVKKGRIRGLGCTLITQRPAAVNKNVLTQCESLFAMRLVHPRDIDAIREWVAVHATPEEEKLVVSDLPTLPVGTAWFWSPGWLGVLKKIKVRPKRTFDSGATPKPGEKRAIPKAMAQVDLESLGQKIRYTVDQIKADDPKLLKRRIAELEKQLKSRPAETVEKPIVLTDDLHVLRTSVIQLLGIVSNLDVSTGKIKEALAAVQSPKPATTPVKPKSMVRQIVAPVTERRRGDIGSVEAKGVQMSANICTTLDKAEFRVLRSLFWLRNEQTTPAKVAFFAGYTVNGHFNNTLGKLRSRHLVDAWKITTVGESTLPADVEDKPTGEELREWLRPKLDSPHNKILDVLMACSGERVPIADLAEAAGYTVNGHFNNVLGKLRTLQIAEGGAREGGVRANPVFFE